MNANVHVVDSEACKIDACAVSAGMLLLLLMLMCDGAWSASRWDDK